MKLTVSERPAHAAVRCAVAARLFLGLAVEMPATRNGAWISALIGGLLAAPWLICLRYARNRAAWPLRLSLVLIALPDAANVLAATVRCAGYLALDRASPALLAVPLGLAMLWSVWRCGDAIGYAGMIWARIALPVLLAVALLQGRYLRPAWLAPVLGSGWPSLITGGVHAAGWIVSASAVLAVADNESARPAYGALACGAAMAAALILLTGMLTPTRTSSAWLIRLDDVLCNGRTPLYLQLPLIALWFAALFHLLASQCFAVAALVKRMTGLNGKLCGAAAVLAVLGLSRSALLPALADGIANYGFLIVSTCTVLSMRMKGGRKACGSQAYSS